MGCYPHFILPGRSSRGFASTDGNLRPVRTRFRWGSAAAPLNHAAGRKSPDHYAKGTPSGRLTRSHGPPTACRRVVSGSLSSPYRGSSHRSLALLGSLSVAREYLALRDGPRGFEPGSTCPALLRCPTGGPRLRVRDCHPLWSPVPGRFRSARSCSLPPIKGSRVLQPRPDGSGRFGLVPVRSPLLGQSRLLSSPGGTEMFQFPPFASAAYGFSSGSFGYPGLNARLTAPPGLSQSSTPFLASWRPDIPHTPLVAWPHRSRPPALTDRRPEDPAATGPVRWTGPE
jgi:hypothetical protein